MASFEEKVEALRRLKEKKLIRSAAPAAKPETKSEVEAVGIASGIHEKRPSAFGPGGAGEADTLYCLAHCMEHGTHDCPQDRALAASVYEQAAEKGHVAAQWRIGEMYETGDVVTSNEQLAASWYLRAAQGGHAHAQSSLALLYEDGRGVDLNDEEALRWHLAAAEQGHALSQFCASCSIGEGRGAACDPQESRKWLQKSADAGFPPAVRALAEEDEEASPQRGDHDAGNSGSLLGLAARIAQQLADLDDDQASDAIDAILRDLPLTASLTSDIQAENIRGCEVSPPGARVACPAAAA